MKLLRKLGRNWQWVLINILGLALSFACVALVTAFTKQELTYDRFHSKADRIYRVSNSTIVGDRTHHPARIWGEWVPKLPEDYPQIENLVRMVPFKKGVVQIGNERFYSEKMFRVDSSFFDIFDFEWIEGDMDRALTEPKQAVVSRSMAEKYYGTTDVVGKTIDITHQQVDSGFAFTIVGVMEDFPENSHFHADVLTTIPDMTYNNSWGYTYYLMKKGTDVEKLRGTIQKNWDEDLEEGHLRHVIHFQKLTDIHLYSHKTREIETNGDVKSVILLASGALIILFIALINFLNLSRVQFISEIKSIKVRMINGATKALVAKDYAMESLVISVSAILMGTLLAKKLGEYMHVDPFAAPGLSGIIVLTFLVGVALLAVYPLLNSKVTADTRVAPSKAGMYTFPLVLQFTLAVVAIAGTIVLQRQINFLNNEHPNAENANILVIEKNPWPVVQRFEPFKTEMLADPSIINVTGAMEEPGGDILDNNTFEMEGIEPSENNIIYIFTIDKDFLKAMHVKPLAGTVDFGYTPPHQWEENALELGTLVNSGSTDEARINELREALGDYREKYILNESALKMLGISDPQEAIGKRFRYNFFLPDLMPEGEIIGVVPDLHYTNLHNEERPLVIIAKKVFTHTFLIELDPNRRDEAIAHLNRVWNKVNPEYPLEYQYISDSYQKVYTTEYAESTVLGLFAIISILLSALGIYAIAAFTIKRRVKEIGLRKVNGATVSEIMLMLNQNFVRWIALAFVIATPIAWYAMHRWLENFAYKVSLSWWIFALAGFVAMAVALVTVSIQSYQAATRNPVDSLRYE